jgi:hypothetical protein
MISPRTCMILALCLFCLSLFSCSQEDDSACPVCPPGPPAQATIQNIWPNADSTAWTYSIVQRQWPDSASPTLWSSVGEVPPAPALADLHDLLWAEQVDDSAETLAGTYRLQFQGQITTESGVQAQLLRETIYSSTHEDPPPPPPAKSDLPSSFYRHLARVRPDLRVRLMERGLVPLESATAVGSGVAALAGNTIEPPLLYLHGHPWKKTSDQICGYGNADTLIAWKYLEQDLSPGHGFTLRLIPSLADDVVLHALILPRRGAVTEAGRFTNCVECAYLIDYGLSEAVTEEGTSLGFFRYWDFGSIIYAPGFGPVMSYQRAPALAPTELAPPEGSFATDWWIRLLGTNARERNP